MRLAHQFLQNFCLGNQNNQVSGKFSLTSIQVYDLINLIWYWVVISFRSGAASQTFRAFHEPRPARGENHVCNISGQFAKRILERELKLTRCHKMCSLNLRITRSFATKWTIKLSSILSNVSRLEENMFRWVSLKCNLSSFLIWPAILPPCRALCTIPAAGTRAQQFVWLSQISQIWSLERFISPWAYYLRTSTMQLCIFCKSWIKRG